VVRRRPLAAVSRRRSIASLQRANRRCRRCLDAGFPIVPPPIVTGRGDQRAYLFGLAPGSVEAERMLPWQGRAGATLRRWLRMGEEAFFETFYCAAVTRCYPGKAPSGRGDRTAGARERLLCAEWTSEELRLLRPALVVTVGLMPARRLIGVRRLDEAVGKSYLLGEAIVVPLPHPSGASGWLNDPANRARLGKALTHVRRELAALPRRLPSHTIAT
jgi:uracil-DNA glycosylase